MNDVYESCAWCGKDFMNIKQIYVDIKTDNYICKKCALIHERHVVDCYGKDDFDG